MILVNEVALGLSGPPHYGAVSPPRNKPELLHLTSELEGHIPAAAVIKIVGLGE